MHGYLKGKISIRLLKSYTDHEICPIAVIVLTRCCLKIQNFDACKVRDLKKRRNTDNPFVHLQALSDKQLSIKDMI